MGVVTTLAIGAAGAGLSFAQAAKLANDNREANRKAAAEMQKLKDRAEIKFTDGLSLNNDLFAQQFEQQMQVSADLINAAQEAGPREVAALAGKIGASQAQQTEAIRLAKQGRMDDIEAKQLEEGSEINQQLLAIETAQIQDRAARDAQTDQAVAGATMSGINSLTSALSSAAKTQSLNKMDKLAKQAGRVFDANKTLLDAAGITREMYQLNPSKYQNIIFNSDGSSILKDGTKDLSSSLTKKTPGLLPTSGMDESTMFSSNIDEGLQTDQKYIKDPNSPFGQGLKLNPNYLNPGTVIPALSEEEMSQNIVDMNYNVGPSGLPAGVQKRQQDILAAGGSLRPQLQIGPEIGMEGYIPGFKAPTYEDILAKYGIAPPQTPTYNF